MAHDDGFDRITHQVLFYPSARSRLRHRPLRVAARERRGLRARDRRPGAVELLLPRERRRPGRSARLPDQARRPRRPAAGPDHHGRVRPAARRGRAVRPSGSPMPGSRRPSAATTAPTTASSRTSPGSRSTTAAFVATGEFLKQSGDDAGCRDPPAGLAVGPLRPVQLLHRRPRARDRRHRHRGSPAEGMAPALEALGRRIEDVRWILLTHGHIDHLGGAHALWELTGRRAQVVIHEADAPLLRSRRAHVDEYLEGRGQYLDDPEGAEKVEAAGKAAISGEMEPTLLVTGGETLSLGGDVTVSVHAIPGHTRRRGRLRRRRPERRLRRRRRAGARRRQLLPRLRRPVRRTARASSTCATRSGRDTCTSDIRTGAPTARPTASNSTPTQAREALQESLDLEARIRDAAQRHLRDGLQQTDSPYSPFAGVAEELRLRRRPRHWNRLRSSRRCTAIAKEHRTPWLSSPTWNAGGETDRGPQGPARPDARRRRARGRRLPGRRRQAAARARGAEPLRQGAAGARPDHAAAAAPEPDVGRLHRGGRHRSDRRRGLRPRHRRPARLRGFRRRAHRQLQRRRRLARPGRVRLHRVGRGAAVVRRQRRHGRHLVLRLDAGARRRRASAAA